jgi:hypothetical protein
MGDDEVEHPEDSEYRLRVFVPSIGDEIMSSSSDSILLLQVRLLVSSAISSST